MEGHSCLQTTCCPVMCLLSLTFAISSCLINYWSFLMLWQDLLIFHLFICSPHLEWSQSHCCPETDHVSLWWCVTFTVYCSQIMFFFAFRCVTFCWRIHSRIHCRVQQLFYLTIVHMFYVFRMMSECHCCPKANHVSLWCRVILVFNKQLIVKSYVFFLWNAPFFLVESIIEVFL